jgi:fatty acid desaturase
MHNLEGITFEEVVDDKGLSYSEYRKTLKPDFAVTWFHITGGLLVIAGICALSWYIESSYPGRFWLTIPFLGSVLGFFIAYISLFIHEAGHFYIHRDKKTNDILANIFLCSWMGTEIKVYRKIHWQHHLHLAAPGDAENSYFHPVNLTLILETLTGIHLLRILAGKNNKELLGKNLKQKGQRMLLAGTAINLLLLFFAVYHNHWQFAIIWATGMLVFYPFFATLRQIFEHRDELAFQNKNYYTDPKNRISRIFSSSLFSRLFGPAGFNKHMIHHWDPLLPFTALSRVEKFLLRCTRTRDIVESSQTTYFAVFKRLSSPR